MFERARVYCRYLAGMTWLVSTAWAEPALREAYQGDFLIGAALNPSCYAPANSPKAELVKAQFNSISPENVLKWSSVEPQAGRFNFAPADQYVDFGVKNGLFVVGHTLVWHSQVPGWVFQDEQGRPLDRAALLARLREHIFSVVGRYKGRVQGWDVVNEALEGDGALRNSPWRKIIGDDYIAQAFAFAHEADPQAELYYNDYGLENEAKRKGALALVAKLKAQGVPISGVGLQEHVSLSWPSLAELDKAIQDFGKLGVKVMITELDVNVLPDRAKQEAGNADVGRVEAADAALNPYATGLPPDIQQQLAKRYAELFAVYLKNRGTITRVTFWGVTDGDSWLNNFPIKGRTNYPLLFDRQGKPKPAYFAVLSAAQATALKP